MQAHDRGIGAGQEDTITSRQTMPTRIEARAGNDTVFGGTDDDSIIGEGGDDEVRADDGGDWDRALSGTGKWIAGLLGNDGTMVGTKSTGVTASTS